MSHQVRALSLADMYPAFTAARHWRAQSRGGMSMAHHDSGA